MTPDRAALVQEAERRRSTKWCTNVGTRATCREEWPTAVRGWCSSCLLAALVETEPQLAAAEAEEREGTR